MKPSVAALRREVEFLDHLLATAKKERRYLGRRSREILDAQVQRAIAERREILSAIDLLAWSGLGNPLRVTRRRAAAPRAAGRRALDRYWSERFTA